MQSRGSELGSVGLAETLVFLFGLILSPLHRPHSALQSLQNQVSFSEPNSFSLRFAHDT